MKRNALRTLLVIASGIPLAACAVEEVEEPDVIAAPAAVPIGEAVDCVQISRIESTEVHGNRIIDFEMLGGTIYRNVLPFECPGLGFEERFGYETTIGRLCDVDTITVLRTGGINGPTCGLGPFIPVRITGPERD